MYSSSEENFLEEFLDDLHGSLSKIAYGELEESITKILIDDKKYFKDRYEPYLKYCYSDFADFHILPAYQLFVELDSNIEDIKYVATEIISEYLSHFIAGESEMVENIKMRDNNFNNFFDRN